MKPDGFPQDTVADALQEWSEISEHPAGFYVAETDARHVNEEVVSLDDIAGTFEACHFHAPLSDHCNVALDEVVQVVAQRFTKDHSRAEPTVSLGDDQEPNVAQA